MDRVYGYIVEIEFYKTRVFVKCAFSRNPAFGVILERVSITDELRVGDKLAVKLPGYILWTSSRYPSECEDVHIPMVKAPVERPSWWKRFLLRHVTVPKMWMQ
jgi:hypothetical protein